MKAQTGDNAFPVAIVLGARVRPDGSASRRLRQRVAHAVSLSRIHESLHFIMSGGGRAEGWCESDVMMQLARDAGVPESALIAEPQSRNTFENLLYSSSIIVGLPVSKVILVTDDWHMKRALMCSRAVQLAVEPAPLMTEQASLSNAVHRLREIPARIKYRFMLRRWMRNTNLSGQ